MFVVPANYLPWSCLDASFRLGPGWLTQALFQKERIKKERKDKFLFSVRWVNATEQHTLLLIGIPAAIANGQFGLRATTNSFWFSSLYVKNWTCYRSSVFVDLILSSEYHLGPSNLKWITTRSQSKLEVDSWANYKLQVSFIQPSSSFLSAVKKYANMITSINGKESRKYDCRFFWEWTGACER